MEKLILTNMCMVQDVETDRVLVIDRIKGSWTGYAFPGGHVEAGEPIVDSVIREVWEETGLTVSRLKICGVKDWYVPEENLREIVVLFSTQSYSGTLVENGEEGRVHWVARSELMQLPLARGFGNTARVMMEEALNEQFFEQTGVGQWIEYIK